MKRSLTDIKGVGPGLASKFAQLGIKDAVDLFNYFPRRYEDFSSVSPIKQIKPGTVTIEAKLKQIRGRYARRGMHVTEAIASDESGSVRLVWFNQSYRLTSLKTDVPYYVSGTFALRRQRLNIINPSIELVSDLPVNTARILPIYKETKGLTSQQIRRILSTFRPEINKLEESLPDWLVRDHHLISRSQAYRGIHFPTTAEDIKKSQHRLGFEEVFQLSLAALLNKMEIKSEQSIAVPFQLELAKKFVSGLPFQLTDAQRKVIWRIYQDLQKDRPMNRLVEGDVGAGKTVVAIMSSLMALAQGLQVALMAPTELLARQHAETIKQLLRPLGWAESVSLLVGGLKANEKADQHQAIKRSDVKFIVGTQALLQSRVDMHRLALIIIDEQHRFGVEQRKNLMKKAGHMPHVLSLTATPIPRSLALTLYGELDLSILTAKPTNRLPIQTTICSPNSKIRLYKSIDEKIALGQQMFVVCPLISPNEDSHSHSAEEIYKEFASKHFKHRRVGLLHGQLKPAEKNEVMQKFVAGEIDILVSTTVIEVGVDVPNATVMLIMSAERFGLAQLHQLRGRIGRGSQQGYCYLMMSDSAEPSARLRALESSNDGFKLAELDLKLRGPGAIYGTSQHGLLDLRIANLSDAKLIAAAREAADQFLGRKESLLQYKPLAAKIDELRSITNLN